MRELVFEQRAFDDLTWWIGQDRKVALRLMKLIENVQRTPFEGLGKPEPLKHELSGMWSRRINREHRLVYTVSDEQIKIVSCRFHYK